MSINLFIRRAHAERNARIWYARVDEWWRKEQKYNFLDSVGSKDNVTWEEISPDSAFNWLTTGMREEFTTFVPIGDKSDKSDPEAVFETFSNGVKTNRDAWAYNLSTTELTANIRRMIDTYNGDVMRWLHSHLKKEQIDSFVTSDESKIGWSGDLKSAVVDGEMASFGSERIRTAIYRPFVKSHLYFDRLLNNSVYRIPAIFPTGGSESENAAIWLKVGTEWPMFSLAIQNVPDLLPQGGSQVFPFYTYAEDGTNRRENITDWALEQFRVRYGDRFRHQVGLSLRLCPPAPPRVPPALRREPPPRAAPHSLRRLRSIHLSS